MSEWSFVLNLAGAPNMAEAFVKVLVHGQLQYVVFRAARENNNAFNINFPDVATVCNACASRAV